MFWSTNLAKLINVRKFNPNIKSMKIFDAMYPSNPLFILVLKEKQQVDFSGLGKQAFYSLRLEFQS
jgi:hypothetical protein